MESVSASFAIESLDLEARGVAKGEGKVTFVRGALPGETVTARIVRRKPRFDVAELESVQQASAARVVPPCAHFGVCGGCSMQHIEPRVQVAIKQRVLEDTLWHVGKVKAQTVVAPIVGPASGYRFRARLSVRHVPKKGGVLVGFHERGSSYVADMRNCQVLSPKVAGLLWPLRELVAGLSIRDRLPQVEVAQGDAVLALVFRVLEPPSVLDEAALRAFGQRHALEVWLQPAGPDSIELLYAPTGASALAYAMPEFGIQMPFRPTDFTQVNPAINAVLVGRAVRALGVQPGDRVADLFCGLGNFTLPLATRAAAVLGVEGSASLVARAQANAQANGLAAHTRFAVANLFNLTAPDWAQWGAFDRVLLDPPREGALAVAQVLAAQSAAARPRRLVYVSCNPATLARDAAVLLHEGGWQLREVGVLNMFPHTSHVESMAVFEDPA